MEGGDAWPQGQGRRRQRKAGAYALRHPGRSTPGAVKPRSYDQPVYTPPWLGYQSILNSKWEALCQGQLKLLASAEPFLFDASQNFLIDFLALL